MSRFREVVIESASRLKLRNNSLVIETVDGNQEVSLNQVDSVVIDTRQCIVSVPILVAFSENNINLVLTNKRYQPVSIYSKDCLVNQFKWKNDTKNKLWQLIIQSKVRNQVELANLSEFDVFSNIKDSDEALVAKKYFHVLFGQDFRRDFVTGIVNSALNYGYMIFVYRLATEIMSHGYANVLGIHHHSEENDLNLSCDLVEPWRIVVDQYVQKYQNDNFDQLYRQNLVDLLNLPVIYNGVNYETIIIAMQHYVNDCLAMLNGNSDLDKIEVKLIDNEAVHHV